MSTVRAFQRFARRAQPLLLNELFQVLELLRTEAAKVVVQDIDARDCPVSQMVEERIVSEPLEVEGALRSRDRGGLPDASHASVVVAPVPQSS